MKKFAKIALKVLFPLLLGLLILCWVYRDFDFSQVSRTLLHETNWLWFALSLVAGVLSHAVRGWRWNLALAPMGLRAKPSHCVYAIFISYAANIVLPRVGEVSRCSVLEGYDGISFSKSLGTVVAERLIDTVCVLAVVALAFLLQGGVLVRFFTENGVDGSSLVERLTSPAFIIVALCAVAVLLMLWLVLRRLSIYNKVKRQLANVWEGFVSLRSVKSPALFWGETAAIWLLYFLQFYLCFFCFGFSQSLSPLAGLVMFAAGSVAVVVPTPNGAGPWHFAVMSIMMIYGVGYDDAGLFALIVHSSQTLLLVVLGVYALTMLQFEKKHPKQNHKKQDEL